MVDFHLEGAPWHCPVPKCERRDYESLTALRAHLDKAVSEGDATHMDVIELEGWNEKPLEPN